MQSKLELLRRSRRELLLLGFILTIGIGMMIFAAGSSAQYNGNMRSGNGNFVPELPKSIVRGRIVYEESGRPVRRAPFSLLNLKGGGSKSGLTTENGEFVLKDVAEGRYYVFVNAPGVLNFLSYLDFSADSPEKAQEAASENLNLMFEEVVIPAGGGEVMIFARAKHGAAIGGRISYADGSPAIGVRVDILRKTEGKYLGVLSNFSDITPREVPGVKTDDRGVYRVSGLPPGEYLVRAIEPASHNSESPSSYEPFGVTNSTSLLATYYPNVNSTETASVVTVEIGQEAAEINIVIPEYTLFNAAGKVVAKGTEKPINGASINLIRKDEVFTINERISGEDRNGVKTDATGAWNFRELPAGTYTLKIKPPRSDSGETDTDGDGKPDKPAQPKYAPLEKEITLTDKDLANFVIELPLAGGIAGNVTTDNNKPLPRSLTITVSDGKGETVDSDYLSTYDYSKDKPLLVPQFNLDNLPAGKFYLDVKTYDYGRDGAEEKIYYLKSVKAGAKDYLAAPFELGEGSIVDKVQIVSGTDGGKLKGKVKTKDDKPAVGKRILLIPTETGKWNNSNLRLFASTDSTGEFQTQGAPAEYFVVFFKDKEKITDINADWIREHTAGAEKITIKAGDETTVNLVAP